ncbi:unnamed protein product, partial [Symbiodinium sp. CCMP2456]
ENTTFFCGFPMSSPSEDQLAQALSGVPQAMKAALYEAVLSFSEPGSALADASGAAERAGWHKGSSGSISDAELFQRALLGYSSPAVPASASCSAEPPSAMRSAHAESSNKPADTAPAEPATPPGEKVRSPTSPAEQVKEEAQAAEPPDSAMEPDEGEESEEEDESEDSHSSDDRAEAHVSRKRPPPPTSRRARSARNRASDTDAAEASAPPTQAKGSAPPPADDAPRQVFLCSGCDTQMNIWEDRASEYVCSACGLHEQYQAAVLLYDRPSASGAVGQFSGTVFRLSFLTRPLVQCTLPWPSLQP